ncbi:MAG: fructosamine kinase family protein [Treponema sp.]|nr:fructosamine kinase family protein [Treponema sp.]
MHKAAAKEFTDGKKFGFLSDNFIGARPQKNLNSDSWVSFFRDSRLSPQFDCASSYLDENALWSFAPKWPRFCYAKLAD